MAPWQETILETGELDPFRTSSSDVSERLQDWLANMFSCLQAFFFFFADPTDIDADIDRYKYNYRLCYLVVSAEQMESHLLGKAQKSSQVQGLGQTEGPQPQESK